MENYVNFSDPSLVETLNDLPSVFLDTMIFSVDPVDINDIGTVIESIVSDEVGQTFEVGGADIEFRPVYFTFNNPVLFDVSTRQSIMSIQNDENFDVESLIAAKDDSMTRRIRMSFRRFHLGRREALDIYTANLFISQIRRTVLGVEITGDVINAGSINFPVETISNLNFSIL